MINFIFLSMPDIVLSGMQYLSAGFCRLLIVLCTPLFLFSCKEKEQPLSKAEALEVARKIDSTIDKKQPKYFNELLDIDLLAERVAKTSKKISLKEIKSGLKKSWRNVQLGDNVLGSIKDEGHYQLVKHYEKEGVHHLIYRFYGGGGLDYHDLELTKYKGKPRIADVFIYSSSENMSRTMSDLVSTFMDIKNDKEADEAASSILKIRQYVDAGEFEKAESYYEGLPANIKGQRSVRLFAIAMYQELDQNKYLAEMESFKQRFPDLPTMDLMMIDAYLIRKEYPKAIEAIDRLDNFINKDSFLDFYRALIFSTEGNEEKAIGYFEKLYKSNPDFAEGIVELIANYIIVGRYEDANRVITSYKKNDVFDQQRLENYLATQPQFEYKNPQ